MARMHSRLLPALIGLVGLAGCATTGGPGTKIATPGMPNPEVALRQSMEQVGRQLSQLGGVSLADWAAGPEGAQAADGAAPAPGAGAAPAGPAGR